MGDPQHWNHRYESSLPKTLSWYEEKPVRSLEMILRCSGPGDAILDVGAGASTLVDYLLREQYAHVSLLDISPAAFETTKRRLGADADKVEFLVADVGHFQPTQMYDVWHDRAAFHFLVTEQDRSGYKRALLSGLRPGGTFIVATYAHGGPNQCSSLPVRHYDRSELEDFLGEEFVCHGALTDDHETPSGKLLPFHWAVFERRLD